MNDLKEIKILTNVTILINGVMYDTGYTASFTLCLTATAKSTIDRTINDTVNIALLTFTNPYGICRLILFLI